MGGISATIEAQRSVMIAHGCRGVEQATPVLIDTGDDEQARRGHPAPQTRERSAPFAPPTPVVTA